MSRSRTLASMLLAGAVLFALGRLASGPAPLVVKVPAGASAAERERVIDEALLVELGLGVGWREDPVVAEVLTRNLTFIGVVGDRASLLSRAAELDLPRRDPLARARLAARGASLLTRVRPPTDAELEALRTAEAEGFRRPTLYQLEHQRLGRDGAPTPELLLGPRSTRSEAQLAATLGPEAAKTIASLPVDPTRWVSLRSRLGEHRVRLLARTPGEVPPLASIRAELTQRWTERQQARALREGLERLRAQRPVVIEEVAP